MISPEEIVVAAAAALRPQYDDVRLSLVEVLRDSQRSTVVRARILGGLDGRETVIVKVHDLARSGDSPAREPAALQVLNALTAGIGPELLARASDPPLLVMSDLGSGSSLADVLLGNDPDAAAAGVVAWADTMARLHAATSDATAALGAALSSETLRLALPPSVADDTQHLADFAIESLGECFGPLGLTLSSAAAAELRGIPSLLGGGAAMRCLTPADACPDNNVLDAQGLALFDFEHAEVRHAAWDVTYLHIPWASCWCSWALPPEVAAAGVARWRAVAGATMPYVATADFDLDISAVRMAWTLVTVGWYMGLALKPPAVEGAALSPGALPEAPARPRIQHRLAGVLVDPDPRLPALAQLCSQLLDATVAEWGRLVLLEAPAFRG